MVIDLYDAINEGTYYGLTVTKNADRTVTVSGELDREYGQITALIPFHLPNGAVLKRADDNATGIGFQLKYYEIGSETALYANLSTARTIDYDTYENYQLYIQVIRSSFTSPVTFTPLVRSSKGLCSNYRAMVRRRNVILANQRVQTRNTLYLYYLGENENAWHFTGKDHASSTYAFNADNIQEKSYSDGVYIETIQRVDSRPYALFGGRVKNTLHGASDYTNISLCTNGNITNTEQSFGRVATTDIKGNGSKWAAVDISNINGDYYGLFWVQSVWTQSSSYANSPEANLYAMYLAKQDDISPLAMYGNTVEAIIANASSLFTSGMAVTAMVKTCTGSFMWKALADNGFVTAMRASSFFANVQNNPEWSKAIALLDY